MSSFFRNLKPSSNARECAIKENLISVLSENAREIQYECKENVTDYLELEDCTSSLCTTLEAFFVHGLKDSFLSQTINVIGGGDVDRRPEPNFWSPLLVFLHKQTIQQIQGQSQITTEVGYCRSWIRLSLNESLLSSYLNNIRKNGSALSPYYKKHAILKDTDTMEVAAKILEGIETAVQINLPVNSTLLNRWPEQTLQMAGLWTPPLRSCSIANGIDVANSLTETVTIPTPHALHIDEIFSDSISSSPFNQSVLRATADLTDNEHLQIFLKKFDEIREDTTTTTTGRPAEDGAVETEENRSTETQQSQNETVSLCSPVNSDEQLMGNSIAGQMKWSGRDDNNENNSNSIHQPATDFSRSNSMTQSIGSLKSPIDHHSYNTLLVKHRKTRELDWNDVWERFESSLGITNDSGVMLDQQPSIVGDETRSDDGDADNFESLGFEIVPQTLSEKFSTIELQQLVEHACKLARERGLDSQGFVCKLCSHPLGIGFAVAQVCAFTGHYYCEKCMSAEQFSIPAKIIYNWDFRKYSVSKKSAAFINEFQLQPFIDLKLLNRDIYGSSIEMAELQSLRVRLNFIRAYLFTCCEPIIQSLQKMVWSREYLYEHIHSYSIADLQLIQRGTLAQLLQRTVTFGEQHIVNCPLCSVKGFICEICNSSRVLYPFHVDTTFRCELCGAVFHDQCLNDSQPCPKCERKRKRVDLPLFEAVHML